jgi:molecular chaperone HscA
VPLVARLLHGELGIAPAVLEQPELPVAEGAIIVVAATDNAVAPAEPVGAATRDDAAAWAVPNSAGASAAPMPAATRDDAAVQAVRAGTGAPDNPAVPAARAGAATADSAADQADPAGAATPDRAATSAGSVGAGASDGAATPAAPMRPAAVPPISDTMTHPAPAAEGGAPGLISTEAMQPTSAAAAPSAAPSQHSKPAAVVAAGGSQGAEPHYAEPVDPWATGEAAAFGNVGGGPVLHPVSGAPVSGAATPPGAESWLASKHPDPGAAGEPGARAKLPAYQRKVVWIVAAATAVVLGAAATVVALFWPGYPALDYEPLADLHRIKPAVPVSSAFSAAALRDGRAYFASADDTNTLGVVAAATDTGKTDWTSTAAGSANRWEFFFTIPDAVVAVTGIDSITGQRRVVLLDAADGKKLWERAMDGYDNVIFAGDRVVLIDRREGRLLGLDPRTGKGLWEKRNPKSEYGQTTTQVVAVTTEDDFAGPAGTDGVAFAEPFDDDKRIVQIGADDSAQVRDADSGDVVAGPRQSVAQTDDKVIAHNGRLIVAESTDAHRLFAYDLKKLEPKLLYTPPSTNSRLEHLTPCGADRICLIETTGSDAKTAQVVAIDAAEGGVVWRRAVADAEDLVAVGEAVLVPRNTSPAQVSLVASDGRIAWTRAGAAGRLDAGNTLQFSKALSASADDPALAGEHVGDKAVPLGSLADVRSSTCAWDTSHLACVADADFVIQRFVE